MHHQRRFGDPQPRPAVRLRHRDPQPAELRHLAPEIAIDVRGLTKKFGERVVVRDLDLIAGFTDGALRTLIGTVLAVGTHADLQRDCETYRQMLGGDAPDDGRRPGDASPGRTVADGAGDPSVTAAPSDLVVLASGNLGLIQARTERRLLLHEIDERWPRLVPGLVARTTIGCVVAMTAADGPVAIGPDGLHVLRTGAVIGAHDPLAAYGAGAHVSRTQGARDESHRVGAALRVRVRRRDAARGAGALASGVR